jgi:hypothetical protein
MERLKADSPLARRLETSRAAVNESVARAQRANPGFDAGAFAAFACGPLDALARAVGAAAPERADTAAGELFGLALELFASNLLGGTDPGRPLESAWSRVLPAAARCLADDPRGVATAVTNLVLNLQRERPQIAARWVDAAVPLAARASGTRSFLDAALVAAWRCGLAHGRDTALAAWRRLPDPVKPIALGMAPAAPLPVDIEARLADPWWSPSAPPGLAPELRIVARAGRFRGFGGPFTRPPQVGCADGLLIAFDRDGCWALHADHFGVVLKRIGSDPPSDLQLPNPSFTIDRAGRVTKGTTSRVFRELADSAGFASTGWTLAVTLRHSHQVCLVAAAAEPGVA